MPRVLVLVLVAGALVWAAALVRVDQPNKPVAPAAEPPEPEATTSAAPSSPAPAVAVRAQSAKRDLLGPPPPPSNTVRVQPTGPQALWASASATMRAARDAVIPGPPAPPAAATPQPGEVATGELGEGALSPEYTAAERAYVYEPRDGAWAAPQEEQLRSVLRSSPLVQKLSIVNCQQTICRLVFEQAPQDAFRQLLQVRGLSALTGLSANTPYSYRAGQLSVYFARRSAIVPASP